MSNYACIKCMDSKPHPFHDNGDINLEWDMTPSIEPPTHLAPDYDLKDSGKRQEFEGGMVRDTEEGKVDYSNLFLHFEPMGTRYAEHMTKGRRKYPDPEPGVPNWKLADPTPEAMERFKRSADRHYKQWRNGETDEDHAAAVLFNINGAEYVKAMLPEDEGPEEGPRPRVLVGSGDRVRLKNVRVKGTLGSFFPEFVTLGMRDQAGWWTVVDNEFLLDEDQIDERWS